ncbi:hypothetical protein F2Q68_00032447 [Brassica cretica]|uniref:Arabidopsis retrotransposon Orf1 C-terminal domain-containing protein n=1 Tax=Brassica cretica TaxID=69181 RepID=A0A8S9GJU9_BRACR|nr:hypothetical protein F2Q68_00032447 [Brassica cretica]
MVLRWFCLSKPTGGGCVCGLGVLLSRFLVSSTGCGGSVLTFASEAGKEKGEDQAADTERGENSHVAENVDGTADVSGRNKRKHADRGAESRKKNVLCQLAASSKRNIDTDMKNFLEGLVQASFITFGEKFCQLSDRLRKIETEVTQLRTASERTEQFETVVTDRLGKIEAEVTQLRTTLLVTELVGKSDQASGPTMTKINTGPSTSKKGTAPSKKKTVKKQELKTADSYVNLPRANVTQSLASDLLMEASRFFGLVRTSKIIREASRFFGLIGTSKIIEEASRFIGTSKIIASEGKLTFLCRGLLYEMSIHELCTLFGFETRHEACSLPKFPCAYLLWGKIADSSYVSREAKLAMLRNPVLRVVAKYLGHLLLGKSEARSLTEDEAQLIHYGLPLALRPTYDVTNEPPAELSVNMGALFAQMLFERKFRGLRPLDKKPLDESIGKNVDGTADVSGRNKRKHADRGAESRKKNVLCQLAASSKGNIDTDMKNFLEGLVQASFTIFGDKFCQQFSDRLGKIETEVTQLRTTSERNEQYETVETDRLGKIEAEVTQLRTTLVVTELVGKSDQASGPSMTKINTGHSTSKKGTAPSKKKTDDSCVNLPRANVTQSSASDLRMGTQEFLESCMKNLPLDIFVKGLNPSQAKVEDSLDWLELPKSLKKPADSLDWLELPKSLKKPADSLELPKSLKKPAVRLDDRDMELDGEDFPDHCLVFVHPADFKKMQDWQNTRTYVIPLAIQIGPSMLDDDLAGRIMSASSWLKNYVFDCGGRKKIKEVEAFAQLIPRIVKAVQSLTVQKHLTIIPYNVSYVPMSGLNRLNCHCGVYTIKHIECHVLGLDISLKMVKKGAPKKTKEATLAATQTLDTTAASTSSQPESDEPRKAAPWPHDPLIPFSKLPTIHS